ncbi:hypothetical protein Q5752_003302 [Cryptotrichosporon argae]
MSRQSRDPDLELSAYGPSSASHGESSSSPLLNDHAPPPSPSRRRRQTAHGRHPALVGLRRWWKPLAALSFPFVCLFIYALVHPYVPGLPPLPTVSIDTGKTALRDCLCGATREGERLCSVYRPEGLRTSRLVEGTGARVRNMLAHARDGRPIKVGILGGSVSACHGVHPSKDYPQGDPNGPGCYPSLVKDWFEATFPDNDVEFMNGAIGGMDSSYYAFCGTHHIALDVDLIVLEFDVNDQTDIIYQSFFDQLLRVLLEFQSQPAVVILGSWSPQVAQDVGYGDPQMVHLPIAHYYDIPYISMKRVVFNHYLRYPDSMAQAFFQPDLLHPKARGHRVLADLLISYLESELCMLATHGLPVVPEHADTIASTLSSSSLVEVPFPLDTLHLVDPVTPPDNWESTFDPAPLARLTSEARHFVLPLTPYSLPPVAAFTPLRDVVDPHRPDPPSGRHVLGLAQPKLFCADANDRAHPMRPTSYEGWREFVWNGEKHFWVSDTVSARIRVEIKVSAGRVAIYYFRSQHYDLGDAKCWVDDNEQGAVDLAGYWTKQYNVAVVEYIDRNVTAGDHYVTCEVAPTTSHPTNPGAHNFRIVAVMAT